MSTQSSLPGPGPAPDQVVRAITEGGDFRVIAASTGNLLRAAFAAQSPPAGPTAEHFGSLLTGTALVRETMSPNHRVQALLKGAGGRGTLLADTHPDGATRGLVQIAKGADAFDLGEGSILQVMRTMASGRVFRGVVAAPAGGDVAAALMTYLQDSEQVVAVLAAGIEWRDGQVVRAGGYVVQLLPGADRGLLMIMTERLEAMPPLPELLAELDGSPQRLLGELLAGMPFDQLDERPLTFRCQCSMESVVASLATLSRDELSELLDEGVLEVSCDYCHTDYRVGRAQVQGLLQPS